MVRLFSNKQSHKVEEIELRSEMQHKDEQIQRLVEENNYLKAQVKSIHNNFLIHEKNYEEFAALGWEGFQSKKDVLEEYRAFRMLTQEEDAAVEEIREIFEMNSEEIGPYLKGFFGRYDILDVMHLLCNKLKEMTMEITSNYPYKFWELKLELESLQSVCDKITDEKNELEDQLKYAAAQAQLTETQRKLRSYHNSLQLREQLNSNNRNVTPRNTRNHFVSTNTLNSDSGKKMRGSRHLFKDFQSEMAQITNLLSPSENTAPAGFKDVFVSWKDKNRTGKELYSMAIHRTNSQDRRSRGTSIKLI